MDGKQSAVHTAPPGPCLSSSVTPEGTPDKHQFSEVIQLSEALVTDWGVSSVVSDGGKTDMVCAPHHFQARYCLTSQAWDKE